ncbi:hypothetical protein GCM10025868_34130 [Angustibacter aerolatus]|uniref:Uncharacterized protein n=1 Tax=Angustibacter aerolatus TaxID=1162965 RepID=A0ABQ6JJJ2_9ACTN|nr:hypothetical protein GCM10025868_34130 [Angustibacter aerolatus]
MSSVTDDDAGAGKSAQYRPWSPPDTISCVFVEHRQVPSLVRSGSARVPAVRS